jgi:hypothetical protein
VTKWLNRDEAFENITEGIVKVIKELLIQNEKGDCTLLASKPTR